MKQVRLFTRMIVVLLLFSFSITGFSQTLLKGSVRDAGNKTPLPYCSIAVKNTRNGTLSNADGIFNIIVKPESDTLIFSYVGYRTQIISVARLMKSPAILMEQSEIRLNEVTIHAGNEFLYDLVDHCRSKLMKHHKEEVAKVYYGLETHTKDQPVELVECYYNAIINGSLIGELKFRNGRIGLASIDNRYFLSLNSSKAIEGISLIDENAHSPFIPLQQSKRHDKKLFTLKLEYANDKEYKITFRPLKDEHEGFSGTMWISKDFTLERIDLSVKNASRQPFVSIFPGVDTLYNVDMDISHHFSEDSSPDYISFSYHVTYRDKRDSVQGEVIPFMTREMYSSGILYFYDYGRPFILPYFEYDESMDDYRKMSIIPYNEVFWNNNNAMLLTEKQKKDLGFFAESGALVNFREGNYGKNFLKVIRTSFGKDSLNSFYYQQFYQSNYIFWSPDERIILSRLSHDRKTDIKQYSTIGKSAVLSDLYNLKVQLLLDVTELGDSVNCKSYTVFDAFNTWFNLPEEPATKAFLNIYFDICEIERRKMEQTLKSSVSKPENIGSIYKSSMASMDEITGRYLKEVILGRDEEKLKGWNQYVLNNLGIDNLKLFPIVKQKVK